MFFEPVAHRSEDTLERLFRLRVPTLNPPHQAASLSTGESIGTA